ncbi:hypothetical protein MUB04_15945 [Acinetobacter indicus]|uniref:hypothetical protein n=1 Tax=Acinetobacter TaxID=469 RepID=UPI0015D20775|nr:MULTISPECIES: hypothetical protein [Acinetobacter]MCP0918031.1 hypothetical protein [Acinetobacter indicus]
MMKTDNKIESSSPFRKVIAATLVPIVFILFFYSFGSILGDMLKLDDLATFQALIFLYVLIGASAAFTFAVFYLLHLFTRKGGPTAFYPDKIPMLFVILFAVLINAFVIIFT